MMFIIELNAWFFVFDGIIAEEKADLSHIAEVARFLIGLYGKGADLSEDDKETLRMAYKVLG